ncbi:MAG: hypothetical protein ACREP0_03915 [Rhodanobacteraceae bacterium]
MYRTAAASVILLAIAFAGHATPPAGGSRSVPFSGGEAIITTAGDVQHVVIRDRAGHTLAASDCSGSTGHYDQIVAFLGNVRTGVRANDRDAVAALIAYPLRVNLGPGKATRVASRHDLLAHYSKIITPGVAGKIGKMNPHVVFCRDGMAMGGDGVIWASLDDHGALRISVINQ